VAREVALGQRASDCGEVSRDRLREPSAIEVVKPRAGEAFERLREPRLPEVAARGRRGAMVEKGLAEAGLRFELGAAGGGQG